MRPIRINNFQRGLSSSPYKADGAFSKAVNLDIFGQEGIARINYLPTKESSTTITDKPICIVGENTIYASDYGGEIYKADGDGSGTWSKIGDNKGKYIVKWKGHIIAVGQTAAINCYKISNSTWYTLDTSTDETADFIYVSKNNDKVYIGHGNHVTTIQEDTDFDANDAGTYTVNENVITLSEGENISCIAERKEDILLGIDQNPTTSGVKRSYIYIYDRSDNTFDFPVKVPEKSINAMFEVGNRVYISAGMEGQIYLFSESGLVPYAKIPYDYEATNQMKVEKYGMTWYKDRLLVAVGQSIYNSSSRFNPCGIYSIKDGKVNLEFAISSGKLGDDNQLNIPVVHSVLGNIDGDTVIFGYYDKANTAYAIDQVTDNNNRVASYGAYFETQLYRIGTPTFKESSRKVDIVLARPLQTGEGIRIKYREDINSSWTTLGTFDYATHGAKTFYQMPFGKKDIINLQLRVELTTGATSKNTPYLHEIIIY